MTLIFEYYIYIIWGYWDNFGGKYIFNIGYMIYIYIYDIYSMRIIIYRGYLLYYDWFILEYLRIFYNRAHDYIF